MKQLLFIMDTFPLGGISKSLLALFNELEDRYAIDLMLMRHEGLFLPLIPPSVNLLQEPIALEFREPHPKFVVRNLRIFTFKQWVEWIGLSLSCCFARLSKGLPGHIQTLDKWLGQHSSPLSKHYDAAIAYQGGRCIYYLIEKVNADVKIGYVHSDYEKNETDNMLYPMDKAYFPQLDYLVTISDKCADALRKFFPEMTKKIRVIENICSTRMINKMAEQKCELNRENDKIVIMTMGRLDWHIKGLDLAVETASLLRDQGRNFVWYFIGDGQYRTKLEQWIKDKSLSSNMKILGAKTNPYPYLRFCDIYVHPSRIEGKSVALDEVKALHKPIVVTNFSTVYDQFKDGVNALISEMTPEDIARSISLLMDSPKERHLLVDNLKGEKIGNEEQALLFESLLQL